MTLGDVLVATPLISGLKKAFQNHKVSMGVGDWARPLLENNSDLDEIIPCNAPWHNKQNCRFPANSPKTFLEGLLYVLFQRNHETLVIINILMGLMYLVADKDPGFYEELEFQIDSGVKGYAGGECWCTKYINFKEERKVAETGLEFLKLMKAEVGIEPRPTIFLTKNETNDAKTLWGVRSESKKRIIR